ncbi:hypothetical protein D3C75_1028830 [compost metagenome]
MIIGGENIQRSGNPAQIQQQVIQEAIIYREQHEGKGIHEHPADEVRQCCKRLYNFLKSGASEFNKKDCEDDRQNGGRNIQRADGKGVAKHSQDLLTLNFIGYHRSEPVKAHEFGSRERNAGPVIIESIDPSVKRQI